LTNALKVAIEEFAADFSGLAVVAVRGFQGVTVIVQSASTKIGVRGCVNILAKAVLLVIVVHGPPVAFQTGPGVLLAIGQALV
jgi:hypothetical protein